MRQLFLIIAWAVAAWSTNYYINNATGSDEAAGTIDAPWKWIHKANETLVAGDTVHIRGGSGHIDTIYIGSTDSDSEGIHPTNSGTEESPIVYKTYGTEKVEFVGNSSFAEGILIVGKAWIKVTGYDGSTSARNFKFSNLKYFLRINDGNTWPPFGTGGTYNEIAYCEFVQTHSVWITNNPAMAASEIQHNSSYNWVHHCKWQKMGGYTLEDVSSCLDIGWEDCGNTTGDTCKDETHDNVIENNDMSQGGHQVVLILNYKNVLRNNILHNEQWYFVDSIYDAVQEKYEVDIWHGYRIIQMQGVHNADFHHGYNLIEGNRISHGSENVNNSNDAAAMHLGIANNIVRYNDMYANGAFAILFESHSIATDGRMSYNHIYNNSFFANGFGANFPDAINPPGRSNPPDRNTIYIAANEEHFPVNSYGGVIKNNIFWKNYTGDTIAVSHMYNEGWMMDSCTGYDVCGDWILSPNYTTEPDFTAENDYASPVVNNTNVDWYWPSTPDGSDITTVNNEPDFTLKSTSNAIDSGTCLTQAYGAGNNTDTLIVDDAKHFQPGWGNGAGGGAVVAADWISVGTVSNTAQIESISYGTDSLYDDTLFLTSNKTWSDNASIWLYKDSDGTVVLYGTAPDAGAHESNYGSTKKYGRVYCTHK
jgi:hypothetical protein